jgi:hypothetical protein
MPETISCLSWLKFSSLRQPLIEEGAGFGRKQENAEALNTWIMR